MFGRMNVKIIWCRHLFGSELELQFSSIADLTCQGIKVTLNNNAC